MYFIFYTHRKLELSFVSGSSEGEGFHLPKPESYSRVIASTGLLMRQHMISHSLWSSSYTPTKYPFYTTWSRLGCLHIIISLVWHSWGAEKVEWEGDLYLAALVQRPSLHTTVAALLSDTLLHILSVLNDLSTKESIESDYFHNYPSLMDMKSWVMLYLLPDCCFCWFFSPCLFTVHVRRNQMALSWQNYGVF